MSESSTKNISRTKTRQLVITALFLALALALSIFESILPPLPTPIPMRYGLANVAVMAALLYLSYGSACVITIGKSIFVLATRGLLAGLTSFSGSVLAFLAMVVLLKLTKEKTPLLILSVTGALFHNLGQFLIFILISRVSLSWPFITGLLLVLAIVTGTVSSLILKALQRPLESWRKHSFYMIMALILIPFSLLFTACTPANTSVSKQEAWTTNYFDTVCRLIVYTDDQERFAGWEYILEERLSELDGKFNIYTNSEDNTNNLKTLNEQAGTKATELDKETMDLLQLGKDAFDKTDGKVNIMLGAVTGLWREARQYSLANPQDSKIPSDEDLENAAKHCDIESLVLDYEAGTAFISDEKASVDVGAIAKGYALDLIVKDLKMAGAENFLLDMGGNIYAAGKNILKDDNWAIGIKNPNPDQETGIIEVLAVKDMTVTTSGSYERGYTHQNINYHHIIDPMTRQPGNIYKSVTIVSADGSWGDILSTALFLTPIKDIESSMSSFKNTEAYFITADDEIISSNNLDLYFPES